MGTNILSEEFLSQYRGKQPNWGFNGLGYIVFKRSYARIKSNGQLEEWWETIQRCIEGAQRLGADYTTEEAQRLYNYVFNLKGCFSGRGLWQLGTPLVDDFKLMDSVLNCWGVTVSNIEDFKFILMESFFGGGVGCNIAKEYTQELPRVKKNVRCRLKNTNDADFIVPDSKSGWVDLWGKILESYLITGKSFTYSTICIRPSGAPIKTFGGIAPGPQPLIEGVAELCRILEHREGKKLRTDDIADIICCGGEMVKSGGVRRTALILGGDVDDIAYLRLKRWDLGNIPNYRSNSNNSLLCPKYEYLQDSFWDGYNGNGEPYGLVNLPLMRKEGRTGEKQFNKLDLTNNDVIICNPCGEANLESKSPCNLSELVINNISSKEEMLDIAKLLYKSQKAICAGNYFHEETNEIVHKTFRIGMSITGICQKLNVVDEWADYTYKGLRVFDKEWSKKKNYPESIRISVIQPSGTKSLLFGSTPGGHPGYSKYFIRRVRFDSKDPLIKVLKEKRYHVEPEIRYDGTANHNLIVVEFPCSFGDETLLAKDCSAVQQLEILKRLQKNWADQSCSITCYYKDSELESIKDWLSTNYNEYVKSVSFLLHKNHNFVQAPYEEISKEQYDDIIKNIEPINNLNISEGSLLNDLECAGGSCPVR